MRRGAWHQCGDRSQRIASEQLRHETGVGVIQSPRDLSRHKAVEYASEYHDLGAHVLIDHQFYEPTFTNDNLASYETSDCRRSVSQLRQISEFGLTELALGLHDIHRELRADGVIAPALAYQVGRPDIIEVNSRLFAAAKQVGDNLGVPTYATVVLGRSATSTADTVSEALSHATSLNADGWYYAYEFEPERVPSSPDAVYRCCAAGLTLACTGKPVLHAFAGPMALLSLGFGAKAAAIGHSQNLWKFTRGRWQPPAGQGGGGAAPPRFFSQTLWGTIVYPDETVQLPAPLRDRVLTLSSFSEPVGAGRDWQKWDANKHLINVIASTVAEIASAEDARANARVALDRLEAAAQLHTEIAQAGLLLGDDTNVYQANWAAALGQLLNDNEDDFNYLSML